MSRCFLSADAQGAGNPTVIGKVAPPPPASALPTPVAKPPAEETEAPLARQVSDPASGAENASTRPEPSEAGRLSEGGMVINLPPELESNLPKPESNEPEPEASQPEP